MERIPISIQANNDAGPEESAVSPGKRSIPDPNTDPIYRGIICFNDNDAVLGIEVSTDITY